MTRTCGACGGAVCEVCGGCINHGECSCVEALIAPYKAQITELTQIVRLVWIAQQENTPGFDALAACEEAGLAEVYYEGRPWQEVIAERIAAYFAKTTIPSTPDQTSQ